MAATKKAPAKKAPAKTTSTVDEAGIKKVLDPFAKEINVRLSKAVEIEGKADDHRLAAALQLAKAEEACAKLKVNFKKWAEANVEQSYETVRKLVPVGKAKDPVKALADLRAGNAQRNKTHRAKKKKTAPAAAEPKAVVSAALSHVSDDNAVKLLGNEAKSRGMALVAQDQASWADMTKLERAKFAFDDLSATERLPFFSHIVGKAGVEITLLGEKIA